MSQFNDGMFSDSNMKIRNVTQAQFDAQKVNFNPDVIYRVDGVLHLPDETTESYASAVTAIKDASGNVVWFGAGGKRVGSVCLLHYENAGGFIALPASAEQIVGSVVLIPANTLKPGDKLRFVCYAEDAGTADAATRSVRVRIHTADSVIPGVVLTSVAISSASNSKFMVDKPAVIISNTASRAIPSGFGSGLITTSAIATSAIDCTVDQYIGLTIQNANTLVNHLLYFANLTLESAQ